jgi:hypothetical protein
MGTLNGCTTGGAPYDEGELIILTTVTLASSNNKLPDDGD